MIAAGHAVVSIARTHVGLVRRVNEDAYLDRPDLGLWAVADGMGGHRDGDYASRLIVERLGQVAPPQSAPAFIAAVQAALADSHQCLRAHAGAGGVCGSTVVVLLIHGRHAAGLWAGDSRLYRLRAGRLRRLSHDHSVVQRLIDAGRLTAAAAERHPEASRITRAVGAAADLEVEAVQDGVEPGDRFLLCSDGLTRMVDDDAIAALLAEPRPEAAADALIRRSLEQGGLDNVTVLVVDYRADRDPGERTVPSRPRARPPSRRAGPR